MVRIVITFSNGKTDDYMLTNSEIVADNDVAREVLVNELIKNFIGDIEDSKIVKVYKSVSDFRAEYQPVFLCSWQIIKFRFEEI